MNGLPRAVFFDLDDTLLNFSGRSAELWLATCERFASATGVDAQEVFSAIDAYRNWFWSDAARHAAKRMDMLEARREIVVGAMATLGSHGRDLAIAIADAYTKACDDSMHLYPDAVETLQRFRDAGVRLALITNGHSSSQRNKIERFGLAAYFDCIVVESEFGVGKPDPSVYRHALSELDGEPSTTWMVGDNLEWDVAAPQRLGIAGIWIDQVGSGLPHGSSVVPHRVINRLLEL